MALFKILKGNSNNLAKVKATDGYAYFTPDDGKFYIDIEDAEIGDVVKGNNSAEMINNKTANRICINPDYKIFDCGTSDENADIANELLYPDIEGVKL